MLPRMICERQSRRPLDAVSIIIIMAIYSIYMRTAPGILIWIAITLTISTLEKVIKITHTKQTNCIITTLHIGHLKEVQVLTKTIIMYIISCNSRIGINIHNNHRTHNLIHMPGNPTVLSPPMNLCSNYHCHNHLTKNNEKSQSGNS